MSYAERPTKRRAPAFPVGRWTFEVARWTFVFRSRFYRLGDTMKPILSIALILGLCTLARAADDKKSDPVGTWALEYAIGDQQRTATLTITKDGDNLAGTMTWANQKDAKLKDVKMKD